MRVIAVAFVIIGILDRTKQAKQTKTPYYWRGGGGGSAGRLGTAAPAVAAATCSCRFMDK
jgi:hypothetical protein